MKPRPLSPSSLKLYMQCPWQYFLRYEKGVRAPATEAMLVGQLFHAACERLVTDPEAYERGAVDFVQLTDNFTKYSRPIADKAEEMFVSFVPTLKQFLSEREIVGIEKDVTLVGEINEDGSARFTCMLPNDATRWLRMQSKAGKTNVVGIRGIFDLVVIDDAGVVEVVDYKTGQWTQNYQELKKDWQAKIYAIIAAELYGDYVITYHYIQGTPVSLSLSPSELNEARLALLSWYRRIVEDEFPAKETGWWCKFCPIYTDCKHGVCQRGLDFTA